MPGGWERSKWYLERKGWVTGRGRLEGTAVRGDWHLGDTGVPGRDGTRMCLMDGAWLCGVLVLAPRCCGVLAGSGADTGLP